MILESAGTFTTLDATESDIRKVFAEDFRRGEYVILSRSEREYVRIKKTIEPHTLECREGNAEYYFECIESITRKEAEQIFIKYFQGDSAWKRKFQWKKVEQKPWWKMWGN